MAISQRYRHDEGQPERLDWCVPQRGRCARLLTRSSAAKLGGTGVASAAAPRRAPPAERAEAHRQKGNAWFAQRAFEEVRPSRAALQAARRAASPEASAEARARPARAQAADCYTSALTALPGEPRALGNRAACYAALGRYSESLADAEAAAKAQPQYAKAHSRRGLALWHMNRYHEAAEAYQRAMQLDGSSADAKEARALTSGVPAFCGI